MSNETTLKSYTKNLTFEGRFTCFSRSRFFHFAHFCSAFRTSPVYASTLTVTFFIFFLIVIVQYDFPDCLSRYHITAFPVPVVFSATFSATSVTSDKLFKFLILNRSADCSVVACSCLFRMRYTFFFDVRCFS